MDPVIFREYDIRGVYNEHFDTDFAALLGQAIATFVSRRNSNARPVMTIGYDARLSSPDLAKSLARGIMKAGGKAIHLGLVTTPMSYFSTFEVPGVNGALMVTGSHNPPEYNGFKISVNQSTIFGDEIQQVRKIIESSDFVEGDGGEESELDLREQYVNRYVQEFGQLKPVNVVLDCGNGAAGSIARRLYEAVGLKPDILFEKPDGMFPNHHPDPTIPENLTALISKVKEFKAQVGIGFDGDADRIGVVDEKGNVIMGDELITLYARAILKDRPGSKIVGDVKCSDRMFDDVAKNGGQPIMWMSGHSLIKQKIKAEKAPFGGELSGHIFFADRNYGTDDALYAGLRIVEILSKSGKALSALIGDLPEAYNTPEIRIDTTEEKKTSIVDVLKSKFSSDTDDYTVNFTDGIRISFADGWALARPSNTQPVLVLRFEANTPEALERIRNQIESVVSPLL